MTTETVRPIVFVVAEPETTTTTFQALKDNLGELGPITDLVLDSALCGDLMTLLSDAIGINALPLTQPQVQVDDNQITITGQATLWQLPPTPVALQFTDGEDGLTFGLTAGDLAGNPAMNLTALAAHILPTAPPLPTLAVAQFVMSATPQAKRCALAVTIQDSWPIPLGVIDMTVGELHLKFAYAHDAVPKVEAEMSGTTTFDQIAATVTVAIGEQLALTCAIPQINFTTLAQTLLTGLALPDDLPAIAFSDVELQVQPQAGDFAFQAASDAPWDFGLGGFAIKQTRLSVSRTAGAIQGNLTVTGAGPIAISNDTRLTGLDLTFDFQQGQSWSATGKLDATILDHPFTLEAEVRQEEGRTFSFAWQSDEPIMLVDTEMATLAVDAVTFTLTRQAATAEPAAASQQSWKLTSHGALNLPHVLENATGSLEIEQNEGHTGLAFVTEEGQISVELPLAAGDSMQTMTFTATPKRIAIGRESVSNGTTKQTVFEAETELAITGLYPTLAAILPASTPVTFRADATGVSLEVASVVEGITLPLPVLNLAEAEATLGEATLSIRKLKLALGRTVALSAEMALDLPDAVNQLFGADVTTQIFNQHLACTIGADMQNGLFFKVLTPIFQVGETEKDGHVRLDFGDFGAVRYAPFMVSYDGTNFAASGEFEQVRPLKLPLTFLQKLFEANPGTKFLADLVPDSLPLKSFTALQHLEDGTLGLDVGALNKVLREFGREIGMKLPNVLFDLLAEIAEHFNRLPADFRNYLEIVIPDFFKFNVAVTPTTGFGLRLDIQTREDEAIRFLYPVLMPVPTLMGVTLRKFSIGELFSGSLLLTEIDAVIDQFDLPTLAAILALPVDQIDMLPDSTQVGRKFTVRNLFMPIVYQAGIPIPLPLFYDDLGFEYLGLEGLGLGMKWQFPKPQGGITDLIGLFQEMAPFFTEADTELDPAVFDNHNLGFRFGIAPGFAQLPEYLGGKVLGSRNQLCEIALGKTFAHVLNVMKHPTLAKMIQLVPFEQRIGTETIRLGAMNIDAAWVIKTTGEELSSQLRDMNKQTGFEKQLRKLTPVGQTALSSLAQLNNTAQGSAVVLLLGNWAVPDLATFNVQVGLAQSPQLGFSGGAAFQGKIGNGMNLQANGNFVFDQGRVKLRGANSLRLADRTVFTGQGDIEIDQQQLRMTGSMDLFPNSAIMTMSGNGALQINQAGDFTFSGTATLLGFTQALDLRATKDGVAFTTSARLFDRFQAALSAQCPFANFATAGFAISATMQNDLFTYLKQHGTAAMTEMSKSATAKLSEAQQKVNAAQDKVNSLQQQINGMQNTIQQERAALQQQLHQAQADVNAKQNQVNSLQAEVDRQRKIVSQERAGAEQTLQKCRNEVNRIQNEINGYHNTINRLNHEISRLKREIEENWWNPKIVGENGAKITAKTGEMGFYYTAIETAKVGLKGAQESLELAKRAVDLAPIDADPRVAGLLATLAGAKTGLEIAQRGLQAIQAGINLAPIDADPRIISLKAARDLATSGLQMTQQGLEGIKQAVGGFASVGVWLLQNGPDRLLNITHAAFAGQLNAVSGGQVTMAVDLTLMGKSYQEKLNFNFHDLDQTVQNLVDALKKHL